MNNPSLYSLPTKTSIKQQTKQLKTMKKIYLQPTISCEEVITEAGFATSTVEWAVGAPGGDIDFEDYQIEL